MSAAQSDNAWLAARPRLRRDLVFAPRAVQERSGYLLEDPTRGKFFRLGLAEYALVAALDGHATVAEAVERSRKAVPHEPLSNANAVAILNWLSSAGLLEQTARGAAANSSSPCPRPWWLNPIFIRVPLVAPDRILDRLMPYLGWFGGKPAVAATLLVAAVSGLVLLPHSGTLARSLQGIFSPGGSLGLLLAWTVLKVLHELGHGVVCRRYGASAREAGLMLLLFVPIPYIDVTSSWRLADRWRRIHIAAAGVLAELCVASLAGLVWAATEPGVVNQLAANVVLMASITTVLFNANPLMRFDGYYILSDLLDLPNLYGQCQAWLRGSLRRLVLGLPTPAAQLPPRLAGFMRVYAVLAWLWRLGVYAGIILAAALLWRGVGLVLAAFAVVMWFAIPFVRWARTTFGASQSSARPNISRLALVLGTSLAGACLVAVTVPWPGAPASAAVIDYAPLYVMRAPSDAWIDRLFVSSGQPVQKGEVLAELRNDDLALESARLAVLIQQAELAIRRLDRERRHAQAQAEGERLLGLHKQRAELEAQRELLYIRAPASGRVVSPRVGELLGTYAHQGQELFSIGNEVRKEVLLAATQDELQRLSHRVGHPVRVALPGGESLTGRLARIKPRASTRPMHAALTAAAGGPLTVQRGGEDSQEESPDDVKLLQPHFEAVVPLSPEAAQRVAAGQTVRVFLGAGRDSIATYLWKSAKSWFRTRTQAAR